MSENTRNEILMNTIPELADIHSGIHDIMHHIQVERLAIAASNHRLGKIYSYLADLQIELDEVSPDNQTYRSSAYNNAKELMQDIVDLPNGKLNSFIRCCLANNGALADKERIRFFPELTEDEVLRMEKVVIRAYKGIER